MSAESHQKRAPALSSEHVRSMPNIVPPQAVSDRSIVDSVAGFINDVALTNAPQTDPKEHILWVKFENLADISDTCLGDDWDVEGNLPPPLLLCIGYGSGVQVWAVPANGEAIEVMSWKHGAVKVLRVLPTPFLSNNSELANDLLDQFIHKRPLMSLCGDCPIPNQPTASSSSSQNQQFNAVNFVSLKDGDLVKSIRFKSPIVDVIANRASIAITFAERIAIFDARTLENRLTMTTCFPCPGGLCPIALGDRWLAYAEKKLMPSKASAGGCFFDGVPSYTATVLNAAKTLGKGLRELGEQVAAGLTGNVGNITNVHLSGASLSTSYVQADGNQPGVVTILDIKHPIKDISPTTGTPVAINGADPIIAHFVAHNEAITAMSFDPSGILLLTADRRGHDFNVFRIQSHPCGSVLAAVHHIYVLHRGDTTSKVQDISFSFDSRWVAVSTLRGTTHVFPITPYGGQPGYRTHSAPHVVNRLSRFHRSAGLSLDGRSSSPLLISEHTVQSTTFANPRLPPFPHPTVVLPLAQLRQPSTFATVASLTSSASSVGSQQGSKRHHMHSRQRHHSTEESHAKPLRVAAIFAKPRSWLLEPPGLIHESPSRMHRSSVDSLFIMAGHGALIQYDLEPRHASNIPKEKICDETPIDLSVEAKAQWILGQRSSAHAELSPPLPSDNWLIKDRVIDSNLNLECSQMEHLKTDERDDRWLSQVEIVTHAGPHRRLWMGPQFIFKTYNTPSGSSLAHIDVESVEVGASRTGTRSTPMNMPILPSTTSRPLVPVLIESGSCSSHEQSPRLLDSFYYESSDSDVIAGPDSQLREDLADAMREAPTVSISRDSDGECSATSNITMDIKSMSWPAAGDQPIPVAQSQTVVVSIVNPQGRVTTVTKPVNTIDSLQESFSSDRYIHENCDETLFRPVVTVISNLNQQQTECFEQMEVSQPIDMPLQLIVPVIDEQFLQQKQREKQVHKNILKEQRLKTEIEQKKNEEISSNIKTAHYFETVQAELEMKPKPIEIKKEDVPLAAVASTSGYQKKGKKTQKYNKKSQFDIKKFDKKDLSPPKILPAQEKCVVQREIVEIKEVEMKMKIIEVPLEIIQAQHEVAESEVIQPELGTVKVSEPETVETCEPEISLKVIAEPIMEVPSKSDQYLTELTEQKLESEAIEEFSSLTEVRSKNEEPIEFLPLSLTETVVAEFAKPLDLIIKKEWKNKKDKYSRKNQQSSEIKKMQQKTVKEDETIKVKPLKVVELKDEFIEIVEELPSDLWPTDDHCEIDSDAIMKISKHEQIGDDEIEIVPHQNSTEIDESPEKSISDMEEPAHDSTIPDVTSVKTDENRFIKNEDFYELDDLPPLETFDGNFETFEENTEKETLPKPDDEQFLHKQELKKKMSEILKNTNMVFAMCSSLKEVQDDEESKSIGSSQIQTSTSSTNTTATATFASASSNQTGEGQDSDYRSLELDMEIESPSEQQTVGEFKIPDVLELKPIEYDDVSSIEVTSSETDADDSSKKSNTKSSLNQEDDEELRPLLATSTTSLISPVLTSSGDASTTITTEADIPTLPEINQKSSQIIASNNGNGNKRKNKKKRR